MPLLFLHLFLETLGVLFSLPGEGYSLRICLTFKNLALLILTRTMEIDYRSGITASRRQEPQFMAFCEVFFSRPTLLGAGGPLVMGLVVVSQKAFPLGEGAVPEAGRKEEGSVYRPEDVFQLLLLTPFQSKLSGLFQVTSGQSAFGFAMSSRSRGENSIAPGKGAGGDCSPSE